MQLLASLTGLQGSLPPMLLVRVKPGRSGSRGVGRVSVVERLRSKLKLQIRQTNYLRLKLGKCYMYTDQKCLIVSMRWQAPSDHVAVLRGGRTT